MKIELFEDYELTDEFFEYYKLDDVLLFSYAEPGAQGLQGNIEAVVKINEKEIGVYSGSYMWNNPKLTEKKVTEFFFLVTMNGISNTDWDCLYMGGGNYLFVRKDYSKDYKEKYDAFIDKMAFILYETWREYSNYILNIYFNNKNDKKLLQRVNEHISVICDQFSIKFTNETNQVNFNLYRKNVRVLLKTGEEIFGIFSDDFEDEHEISVGNVLIKYDEIRLMTPYYAPIEKQLMFVLSKGDIDFLHEIDINMDTNNLLDIIAQLEDYFQTRGIEDNDLNENGIHCESILDKLANLDSLDRELYTYVSIVYDDDIVATTIGEPSFYYKTDIKEISVGDKVLVDRNGKKVVGSVVDVEYREKNNVPYTLEKTKDIIKIIKKNEDNALTLDDIISNLEKELEYVDDKYDLEEICNLYDESNLLFYETGNRMSGAGGIFILYKDGKSKIIYIDEEDDLLYKNFPIAMNLELECDNDFKDLKYSYIFTGFGGKLYIDKSIYNKFLEEAKKMSDKYNLPYNDGFNENFMHGFWLTIAKKII